MVLNSETKIEIRNDIPSEDKFTFENGVNGWETVIFIDTVNHSSIFKEEEVNNHT
jgi:hypothetical protein